MSVPRRLAVLLAASTLTALTALQVPGTLAHAGARTATRAARTATPSVAFDARLDVATTDALAVASSRARAELGSVLGHQGFLSLDPRTGTVRVVGRLDGTLTGRSPAPARLVVMDFVRRHLDALGLTAPDLRTFVFQGDRPDIDGVHHVSWVQEFRGIQAFDNGLKASVTADGRLITLSGSPAHGLGAGIPSAAPGVSAGAAIGRARAAVGAPATPGAADSAQLVLFHGGRSLLAWRTLTDIAPGERDLSVVDATTGRILWQVNLVHNATGAASAWQLYPSTAVPGGGGTQQSVSFPVTDGTALSGPYAHVYLDTKDDNVANTADEIAAVSGTDWSVTPPPFYDTTTTSQNCDPTHACTWNRTAPNSWKPDITQDAAQVYYYLNLYHDHLAAAPIGFDAAAGNFEAADDDAVQAQIFDGAATSGGYPDAFHYNNANMYVPPDGQSPTMQLYLFQRDAFAPHFPSGNAGDDASLVYHEYTHGLSGRLVTLPNGYEALDSQQSGAMGEGWSDWYALDFLVQSGWISDTTASGEVKEGEWITGGDGVRFQAIDCVVGASAAACPGATRTGSGGFTYGDYGKVADGPEIHSDGEIWAQTLWDLRTKLGATVTEELVTRAMALSPPDPSFLDMRNAIIEADQTYLGGADVTALWKVFAHRGMGYFASVEDGNDVTPVQSFALPLDCATTSCGKIRGRIKNSITGAPVRGVRVAIGGHDSGFASTDLDATTGADGRFTIAKVPFHTYADITIDRAGIEPLVVHAFKVDGVVHLRRRVTRDWAALDRGASIVAFTLPDYTPYGCGPSGALDRSLAFGWGSDAPGVAYGSNVTGPRALVVKLPRAIRVTSLAVDPGATCGDPIAASTKAFDVYTRTSHGIWILAVRVTFGADTGVLNPYVPVAGARRVRFVKLVLRSNRGDPIFMDASELSVRGQAA